MVDRMDWAVLTPGICTDACADPSMEHLARRRAGRSSLNQDRAAAWTTTWNCGRISTWETPSG